MKFCANRPRIVDESVEGEIIIIDTQTGSYYSLRDSAAWLWSRITRGEIAEELIKQLQDARPAIDGKEAAAWIKEFIQDLLKEELIRPSESAEKEANQNPSVNLPGTFEKPVCEKFEDMQEYLLADPIHDVDVSGWPHLKDVSSAEKTDKKP